MSRKFGDSNPLGSPLIPKRRPNYDTSPESYNQKASEDQNRVDIHKIQNEYKGEALYSWTTSNIQFGLSNFWGLFPGDNKEVVHVIARVDKLHADKEKPSGPDDVDRILLYPVFTQGPGLKGITKPPYGSDIRITFEDVANKRYGIYLGEVDAEAPGTTTIIERTVTVGGPNGETGRAHAAGAPYDPATAQRAKANKSKIDSSGRIGPRIGMHMWRHKKSWMKKMASLGFPGAKSGNPYIDLKNMGIDAISIKVCCESAVPESNNKWDARGGSREWSDYGPVSQEVALARAAGFTGPDDIHFWGFQWEPTLERARQNATVVANLCNQNGVKHYHWDAERHWANYRREGNEIIYVAQFPGHNRGWQGHKKIYEHIGQTAVTFCATLRELTGGDITIWNLGWAEMLTVDGWNSFDLYEAQCWGGRNINHRVNSKYKTYTQVIAAGGSKIPFVPMLPSPNHHEKHGQWTGDKGPVSFIKEHRDEIPWVWYFSFHINNITLESPGEPKLATQIEELSRIWGGGSVGNVAQKVKAKTDQIKLKEKLEEAMRQACGDGVTDPKEALEMRKSKACQLAYERLLNHERDAEKLAKLSAEQSS